MDNQKEYASSSREEEPVIQRALMPDWLFRDAVKGIIQPWEPENEEVDWGDHVELTIEGLDAKLQSATYMGNTVLHILAIHGHTYLANIICQEDRSMWRAQNKMYETPFHCAAKAGHQNTISALIKFARNEDGETKLKAVLRGRNKRGETALHEAAKRGHEGVVFKLMEVDNLLAFEPNKEGISPLDLATTRATLKDRAMVAKMLEQLPSRNSCFARESAVTNLGVVIQMPQSNGKISTNTPIHFLAGGVNMVGLLLENDISLAYLQDSDGLFPVHLAARAGNTEMVALLMKICPDSGELLDHRERNFFHVAAEENMSDMFIHLLGDETMKDMQETFKRMFNETDNEGNTPLHLATEEGCQSVFTDNPSVKEMDLDLNLRNKKGLRPCDISLIAPKKFPVNSDELMQKLQLIGLGAVLVTTVAFAVAFTPPGGYDPISGSPLLAHKYIFKAFILADTLAFALSVICVAKTIYCGLIVKNPSEGHTIITASTGPMFIFSTAIKCMVLAFGLGLYLILTPVIKLVAILILIMSIFTALEELGAFLIRVRNDEIESIIKGWMESIEESMIGSFFLSEIYFIMSILFIFLFALLN